jgi:peptidoglycan/xylan/chitin deacetylase (PgdA/CDA1 family)
VSLLVPILTYHKIAPVQKGTLFPGLFVSPKMFESQMSFLDRNNYLTVDSKNLFTKHENKKNIAITFDDGYQDFKENAFPIIEKFSLKSIVFLVADYIGKENTWDQNLGDIRSHLMDVHAIKQLLSKGVEFGSHTLSHCHLNELTNAEQEREISQSKDLLEQLLNIEISAFCYPYGHFASETPQIVKKTGYQRAFSTLKGINTYESNQYLLKRIAIRNDTSLPVFIYKLWRAYHRGK